MILDQDVDDRSQSENERGNVDLVRAADWAGVRVRPAAIAALVAKMTQMAPTAPATPARLAKVTPVEPKLTSDHFTPSQPVANITSGSSTPMTK